MAKVYSTGPVLIYTSINSSAGPTTGPTFFGTGQQAPQINIKAEYEQVMNDLTGTKLPVDRLYEGEEAVTSVVVNRYNEILLEAMLARPRSGTPGVNLPGDVGTLLGAEGATYIMWFFFPYAAKAFQTDSVPGYRFPYSFLLSPETISPGTKDKQISLTWQHQRGVVIGGKDQAGTSVSISGTGVSPSAGYATILYDHNMTGLPAIN